jgi:hypothetical protein
VQVSSDGILRIHDAELALESLFDLLEGCRDLVILVQLRGLKDHVALLINHISFSVDQVASPVHPFTSFVDKLCRPGFPDNHKITKLVNIKDTHNLL